MSNKFKSNICLIGFWATGKTTLGMKIAKKLKMDFIDTDQIIMEKFSMSIFEIFDKLGENKFRDAETKEINKIKNIKNTVIACGAGVVLKNNNMVFLKQNSIIIWLDSRGNEIIKRMIRDKDFRILERSELTLKKINEFLKVRKPLYKKYSDLKINTDKKSANDIIKIIVQKIRSTRSSI